MPQITGEIVYLSADEEDRYAIAQANAPIDETGHFTESRVSVRRQQKFLFEAPDHIEYMDVSPKQIVSVSAALIPFLEHDDANRALMGSNMQRQAVPLLRPGSARSWAPASSGRPRSTPARWRSPSIRAKSSRPPATRSMVLEDDGTRRAYRLRKYQRSNQSTCIDQRPVVQKGDRVEKGQVLADSSSTERARWRWARTCSSRS